MLAGWWGDTMSCSSIDTDWIKLVSFSISRAPRQFFNYLITLWLLATYQQLKSRDLGKTQRERETDRQCCVILHKCIQFYRLVVMQFDSFNFQCLLSHTKLSMSIQPGLKCNRISLKFRNQFFLFSRSSMKHFSSKKGKRKQSIYRHDFDENKHIKKYKSMKLSPITFDVCSSLGMFFGPRCRRSAYKANNTYLIFIINIYWNSANYSVRQTHTQVKKEEKTSLWIIQFA